MSEFESSDPRIKEIPPENFMISPGQPHMEIIDTRSQQVWQSLAPVSREDYDAMEIEPHLRRVGHGIGTMDQHCFRRSPDAAEDGPMELAEFGGRRFGNCARPDSPPTQPEGTGGPTRLSVQKHHTLIYHAGRSVDVITLPDGSEYIHVIDGGEQKAPLALPEGWTLRSMEITEELIVELPAPTTAWFFPNRDSFQGPL